MERDEYRRAAPGFFGPRMWVIIFAVVLVFAALMMIPRMWENLDASELMVIQSPVSGDLTCYTSPGVQWQGTGTVTKYPRQGLYTFDHETTKENPVPDTGKELQFNDGGKAHLYGSVNWEMPLDCKSIIEIHKTFGSKEAIETRAVSKMVNLAVYLSGPVMSSTESAAERRSELVELINDQAQKGVYQMIVQNVERPDPITGEKRQMVVTSIARDSAGLPKRQQGSLLEQYHVHLQPLSIAKIKYSDSVETQIRERQVAVQKVQIAQANARKAEQDAITTEKEGQAKAATAKWEQETIKAKEVTKAQQQLEVATLAAKEAEQFKREQILRGEGEAARKQLVMNADGALDQKLEAYKEVQAKWADAFAKFGGAMVPAVSMGGGSGGSAMSNTQQLVDLLGAKTARDLSLDLGTMGRAAVTSPKK